MEVIESDTCAVRHPDADGREPEPGVVDTDPDVDGELGLWFLVLAGVAILLGRSIVASWFDGPRIATWTTVFVSLCLQAVPFLVFGTLISGLVAVFVRAGSVARLLPRRPVLAVPVAGLAGVALPGCECGSVPIAGRLVSSGTPPAAALAFLLSAPAVNPVVLVSTAVAFPGRPEMVLARFVASLATSLVVGWLWAARGRGDLVGGALQAIHEHGSRAETFRATVVHDIHHAGGYLVVGAVAAATLRTIVPPGVLDAVGDAGLVAILALAVLAVLLSVCSEADAFVAAGLSQFSLTARLAFLVVGPTVDLKLIALNTGVFGRAFAVRFVPLTFVAAVDSAAIVGAVLL